MPTEVFVLMCKDTLGELRGYHKATSPLWLSRDLAERHMQGILNKFPMQPWTVVPSVIMTREEYDEMQKTIEELRSEASWLNQHSERLSCTPG
jgi:hypothetical protein